jgi:hypothetical protein
VGGVPPWGGAAVPLQRPGGKRPGGSAKQGPAQAGPRPTGLVSGEAQRRRGAVAQSGERLICNQEVVGSTPISSTKGSGGSRAGGL